MLLATTFGTYQALALFSAMCLLLCGSAFFSASEAAMFSLNWTQQPSASKSKMVDRLISNLLNRSDRLLSTILFFNLVINVTYFAIATILANSFVETNTKLVVIIPLVSLGLLILLGELVPKSLGVAAPLNMSRSVAIPLSWAVAVANPITPVLQSICEFSRRIVWPGMSPEQYLDVTDLERAIELSGNDASLIKHEKDMLQNTVQLSVVRIEEWMRPRSSFLCVDLHDDIGSAITTAATERPNDNPDYVLVSSETSEVAASIRLADVPFTRATDWKAHIRPVLIVAWCQNLGQVFEEMQQKENHVALVVNEFGESIGIVTYEDLIESIFCTDSSKSEAFSQPAFDPTGNLQWEVTGSTSLRRIERALGSRLPRGRHVTVAGVVQNELQRLPQTGDIVHWGDFQIEVCKVPRRGEMLLRMTQLVTSSDMTQE